MSDRKNQTMEDIKMVMSLYDKNGDGVLSDEEIAQIKMDFRNKHGATYEVMKRRYLNNTHHDELPDHAVDLLKDDVHSNDLALRYIAFTGRIARIARYLAYTSDFGEAFRPVVHPLFVKASYGISWAYVIGDVGYEAYNMSYNHGVQGTDLYVTTFKRAVFQSIASMALPAFTIHTVVHQSARLFAKNSRLKRFGPSALGLACVPFLPLYDHPVEHACDFIFAKFYTPKHPSLAAHH